MIHQPPRAAEADAHTGFGAISRAQDQLDVGDPRALIARDDLDALPLSREPAEGNLPLARVLEDVARQRAERA